MKLVSIYLAVRTDSELVFDLEERLSTLVRRARTAHPNVMVDDETFIEFVATRGSLRVVEAHAGDLYLACAVALGVPGAAETFDRDCVAQIPKALTRIDRTPNFVAEIQQRVREKMVVASAQRGPRIAEYAARGSLAAFIRVAAIREAVMEKRTVGRAREEASDEFDAVVERDPVFELVRRKHHDEFQHALRTALATLDRHERSALRLSYLDNLSIDQIGKLFGVHRATAARWITRAQARVRELTLDALRRRLNLDHSEAASLLGDLMNADALSSGMLASSVGVAS